MTHDDDTKYEHNFWSFTIHIGSLEWFAISWYWWHADRQEATGFDWQLRHPLILKMWPRDLYAD